MTDDLTRALRRQIAQLQATQTYLRVAASRALPFANVWRAETRAEQRCHELLTGLGIEMGRLKRATAAGSHSTSVRPVTMARRQARNPAPASGAPAPRRETPAAARGGRRSGLVSFDDPPNDAGSAYVAYDGDDETRTVIGARQPTPPPAQNSRGAPPRASTGGPNRGARPAGARGLTPGPGAPRATPSQPFRTGAARWGRGPESRTPGLAPGNEGLVSVEENAVTPSAGVGGFDPDEEKLFGDDSATVVGDPRDVSPPPSPRQTPTPAASEEPESHARVTGGLYGGSSVPSVRPSSTRPRAAAVQLNTSGVGGRVIGLDDDVEPIEIGAAEDDDEFVESGGGFSVTLQHDDDDLYGPDIEVEEEDVELLNEFDEALDAAPPTLPAVSPAEVAQLYQEAENAVAGGDLGTAADLYSDVIDADPEHLDAHVARGRVFLDLGDYSRAMSDFMVAEEIAQDNPEPQVAIGDLYFARKDYRRAIEYFNAALSLDPEHAMAFCRRGISHYYRKNYNDALEDLLHAQQLRPDIPNLTTYVAMAQKKKQRKKRP